MRLFISYARVDRPYCAQIVDTLGNAHHIWYDHRIQVGQDWWKEIQREIAECEGFVYLISPESARSEYCQKEFAIAMALEKHVFPVLIHPAASLPEPIQHLHYADLTKGLTPKAVSDILNAIYIAERDQGQAGNAYMPNWKKANTPSALPTVKPFIIDPLILIQDFTAAMEIHDYDRAVFLLKQAKEIGCSDIRFINLDEMLQKAEMLLERQTYLREAERLYRPIVPIVKNTQTRTTGCNSWLAFREQFPDYDPERLSEVCLTELLPLLEWREVPAGEVTIEYEQKSVTYYVNAFRIGKYPVTNAQFQAFVDAKDGYNNLEWWNFSPKARRWREENSSPAKPKFQWGDHPRARVSWYEAMAFCAWFNARAVGFGIALPTEQQWQRAAQGDSGRNYPWGDKFAKERCNCKENGSRMTCPVTAYPTGASPYGVFGMAGNVWEWCDSVSYEERTSANHKSTTRAEMSRAVRGGAFISVQQRLTTTYHFYLAPHYRFPTLGFRVVSFER